MKSDLGRTQEKFIQLKQPDTSLNIFEAKSHRYQLGEVLSDADLQNLEHKID